LQNWSEKQLHAVLQDLHAKLLTLNLASIQKAIAQIRVDEKTESL